MNRGPRAWSPPVVVDANDGESAECLGARVGASRVFDGACEFAGELYALHRSEGHAEPRDRETYVRDVVAQGASFGTWVLFPWNGYLVRFPDRRDFEALRTFRNRELISASEQETLRQATVAVLGLSVGSAAVEQFAQSGIGNFFALVDPDRLTVSNLNRVSADITWLGAKKTDAAGCRLSEINPFINQAHFPERFSMAQAKALEPLDVSIIVEEMDDMAAKAEARAFAAERRIPLIMASDVAEVSVVNVERHDLHEVRPFNGRISERAFLRLLGGSASAREREDALVRVTGGYRRLDPRLIRSAMQVGRTLGGLPQLGSIARLGASILDLSAREILLGRPMPSGTYYCAPRRALSLRQPYSQFERFSSLVAAARR